jgi:hypothetical protein
VTVNIQILASGPNKNKNIVNMGVGVTYLIQKMQVAGLMFFLINKHRCYYILALGMNDQA